jgi:lysylphosphatidylglycerol synthetase-like protein (DUF2156 family)
MKNSSDKNIYLTLGLSVLPGLSHIYLGEYHKVPGLFFIDAGIALTLLFSSSYVMSLLMVMIYFVTAVPASVESYQLARYGENTIDTGAKWYVTILLLTTGFAALPLLWKSDRFSKRAKAAWTIAVPLLAAAFFTILIRYWSYFESQLEKILTSIPLF